MTLWRLYGAKLERTANLQGPDKSSGVFDLAGLTTETSQIEIEDCEVRATLLPDSFEAEPEGAPLSGGQLVLQCPACNAETFLGDHYCQECGAVQPAFKEKSDCLKEQFKNLLSSKTKVLLIVLSVFMLSAVTILALSAVAKFPDELDRRLQANHLNDAIELAEKLKLSRFGSLKGRDAELYSTAFHRRALIYAGKKNYKFAMCDLAKVLPSYSKFAEVSKLSSAYGMILFEGNPPSTKVSGENAAKEQQIDDGDRANALKAKPAYIKSANAENAKNVSAVRSAKPSFASNTGTASTPTAASGAPPLSESPAKKKPAATAQSQTETAVSENTKSIKDDAKGQDKEEVNSDSEEKDMALYNRHLADYFSHRQTTGSASKDPPSFSEWVQSGKTDF